MAYIKGCRGFFVIKKEEKGIWAGYSIFISAKRRDRKLIAQV